MTIDGVDPTKATLEGVAAGDDGVWASFNNTIDSGFDLTPEPVTVLYATRIELWAAGAPIPPGPSPIAQRLVVDYDHDFTPDPVVVVPKGVDQRGTFSPLTDIVWTSSLVQNGDTMIQYALVDATDPEAALISPNTAVGNGEFGSIEVRAKNALGQEVRGGFQVKFLAAVTASIERV